MSLLTEQPSFFRPCGDRTGRGRSCRREGLFEDDTQLSEREGSFDDDDDHTRARTKVMASHSSSSWRECVCAKAVVMTQNDAKSVC